MKTNSFLAAVALTTLSLTLASCGEKGDTIQPVIDLIEPAEGEELLIGSEIHLEMELSDNEMLYSYKVEIHNNFNGHDHSKAEAETTPFFFEKSWDISGQKNAHIHHHEIVIPADATPGNYHMMVYCLDEAKNQSYMARSIVLSLDAEPHEE